MKDLVLLKSYPTEFEAELVRTKLEREGIVAMVQSEDLSNVLPSLEYSNGVNVYVNPLDTVRASAIVNSTDDDLTDDMDTSDTTGQHIPG